MSWGILPWVYRVWNSVDFLDLGGYFLPHFREVFSYYLYGNPLVVCCFSLAPFNICSLCLIFVNLINMCLGAFHLGFILFGTLWVSWTWVAISFPMLGKFSTITSSSIFSSLFFFAFFFWDSYDLNVGVFNIVPEVPEVLLISFNSVSFFLSASFTSTILSSTTLILSSASVILLLVLSRVLLISVITLFLID